MRALQLALVCVAGGVAWSILGPLPRAHDPEGPRLFEIGELVIEVPPDLHYGDPPREKQLPEIFLRALLAPDGLALPPDPAPGRGALVDARPIAFVAGREDFATALDGLDAAGQASPAAASEAVPEFDGYRMTGAGFPLAYRAQDSVALVLEAPLVIFCGALLEIGTGPERARACRISADTGTDTVLDLAFSTQTWPPDLWPDLARVLDHTARTLIVQPAPAETGVR